MLTDIVTGALILVKKFSTILKRVKNKSSIEFYSRGTCFLLFLLLVLLPVLNTSCSSTSSSSKKQQISSILSSISPPEKEDLKQLFHDLFAQNELGYTLFGDKPMSFCTPNAFPPKISKRDFIFRLYLEGTRPLFKGLVVWEKIQNQINPKNYSLIIFKDKKCPSFAILLNKKAFEKVLENNIDLFQKYYGKTVTVDLILNDLLDKKSYDEIATTPLFHNDALLGIALGFGRHNAELFQRREELTYPNTSVAMPVPKNGFFSIEEEIDYLWSHLQPTSKTDDWLLRVTQVAFAGDPDNPETHILIKKYALIHEKLISIFDREEWLEIVLSQLAS